MASSSMILGLPSKREVPSSKLGSDICHQPCSPFHGLLTTVLTSEVGPAWWAKITNSKKRRPIRLFVSYFPHLHPTASFISLLVLSFVAQYPTEVQANAAETLCAITRNMGSLLAAKLCSLSFVRRIFAHALEDSPRKSGLVHSLSVCISLLDLRRSASTLLFHSLRGQHMYEAPIAVNREAVNAMLPRLGDLLMLLNVMSDEKILPTPYGELRPPLGKHRLKIVEFIAVLLKAGNQAAEEELVKSGTVKRVIELFFEYPYNNALHHHVESIVSSCLETRNDAVTNHIFRECDLINRLLDADKQAILSGDLKLPTVPAAGKKAPRAGNIGHITRIVNKIAQLGQSTTSIQTYLQDNAVWTEWNCTVLQERNVLENVYRWGCGRPTAMHDTVRDSDDEDFHDRDYDVAALANDLSQAFRTDLFGHDGTEEDHVAVDRDDEEVYFDDESAEVVISSLRLGDDQSSLSTNSNWFTFRDERLDSAPVSTSLSYGMDDVNLSGTANDSSSGSNDDEVVVGEDEELTRTKDSIKPTPSSNPNDTIGFEDSSFESEDVRPVPDWANWDETPAFQVNGSSTNPFLDPSEPTAPPSASPSLFEEHVELVGVEPEGTEKAMEQALKEGVAGEAGPLADSPKASSEELTDKVSSKDFNDTNHWRVEQEVAVLDC